MSSIFSIDPVAAGMTAEGIVRLCDDGIAHAILKRDEIRELTSAPDDQLTNKSVLLAFDELTYALQVGGAFASLMNLAHPDNAVREAAKTTEPKIDAFVTALYMDPKISEVFERYAKKGEKLDGPQQRLLEFTRRDFRRNGLHLDAAGQERLRALNQELTQLGQTFEENIAKATASIELLPEQLEGLPENYRSSHKPNEAGNVVITTDYPDIVPFMKYTKDRAAAKQLFTLNNTRAQKENLPILDKLITLRDEKAKLLGYATWADYVLEPRMAKDAKRVRAFLDDLHKDLKPAAEKEYAELFEIYRANGGTEEKIPTCDAGFVHELAARHKLSLDSQKVSEYFELNTVKSGVLGIAAQLYGIRFVRRDDLPTWHTDVEAYDVNAIDGETIGRCYLDLYPREGKYKHMAVFGIRETTKLNDGSRQIPMCAMVCNFPKPDIHPALLSHDDVTTFFHEFGHLLHHLLSQSELASFAGTSVARDFVEAPSQMFEEWAWSRETLDLFARHHQTGEKLPDDLFAAMTAERSFGIAIFTERQLQLADLDLTYHTRSPGFDTTAVVTEMHSTYSPFAFVDGTTFQATFGHLVGYDAGYYGYQWALSITMDLFSRFKANGIMDPQTAAAYQSDILSRGGSKDENDMVQTFLGREGNAEAYKAYLGIK
jgi:thimet oligopeptidase